MSTPEYSSSALCACGCEETPNPGNRFIHGHSRRLTKPSLNAGMKICANCRTEKPSSEFSPARKSKDGLCSYCKACNAAKVRAYQKANPEKRKATKAASDARNKEKIAASRAAYREANPKKIRASNRAWYEANRERARAYNRAWQEANPERRAAINHNYRAREKDAPGTHTAEDVQAQYDRQKGRCYWCEGEMGDDHHVDHVVPLSQGGSNWPSNLVIACPTCNTSKQDKHPMEFAGVLF